MPPKQKASADPEDGQAAKRSKAEAETQDVKRAVLQPGEKQAAERPEAEPETKDVKSAAQKPINVFAKMMQKPAKVAKADLEQQEKVVAGLSADLERLKAEASVAEEKLREAQARLDLMLLLRSAKASDVWVINDVAILAVLEEKSGRELIKRHGLVVQSGCAYRYAMHRRYGTEYDSDEDHGWEAWDAEAVCYQQPGLVFDAGDEEVADEAKLGLDIRLQHCDCKARRGTKIIDSDTGKRQIVLFETPVTLLLSATALEKIKASNTPSDTE